MRTLRSWILGSVIAAMAVGGVGLSERVSAAPAERHPHIHRALRELRGAREELKGAAHDFGGHRVDALAAVDAAIQQLDVCLKHDKH